MARQQGPESAEPPDWDAEFKPYAQAIGFLVREWNSLQEHFCSIFGDMLHPTQPHIASAIWYTIQNDRTQRSMLLAAAKARLQGREHAARFDAINWAIKRANELGNKRDDVIHSPVSLRLTGQREFIARNDRGHPRAKALSGKDLMAETKRNTDNTFKLRDYALDLHLHLLMVVWDRPDEMRPPLPNKPQILISRPKNTG